MVVSDVAIKSRSWGFYARILNLVEHGRHRLGFGEEINADQGCRKKVLEAVTTLWPYIFDRVGQLEMVAHTHALEMASCGLQGSASCRAAPLVSYWQSVPGDQTWVSPFAPPKG